MANEISYAAYYIFKKKTLCVGYVSTIYNLKVLLKLHCVYLKKKKTYKVAKY